MLLVKGGTICNADATFKADVLIANEKIVQIAPSIAVPKGNCRVIDAVGKLVIPGGIDTHTHCQLPFMGTVAVDDFNHGTRAAVAGGTTTLMDFVVPAKGGQFFFFFFFFSFSEAFVWFRESAQGLRPVESMGRSQGQLRLHAPRCNHVRTKKTYFCFCSFVLD